MGSQEVDEFLRDVSKPDPQQRADDWLLSRRDGATQKHDSLHPHRQALGGAYVYHTAWAGLLDGGVLSLQRLGSHDSEHGDLTQPLCAKWHNSSYMDSEQHTGRSSMMQCLFYALHRSVSEELPRWVGLREIRGLFRHKMSARIEGEAECQNYQTQARCAVTLVHFCSGGSGVG